MLILELLDVLSDAVLTITLFIGDVIADGAGFARIFFVIGHCLSSTPCFPTRGGGFLRRPVDVAEQVRRPPRR